MIMFTTMYGHDDTTTLCGGNFLLKALNQKILRHRVLKYWEQLRRKKMGDNMHGSELCCNFLKI